MVGCFGYHGSLRQSFSLYLAISQRQEERGEMKGKRKILNNPTHTYCEHSMALVPYYYLSQQYVSALSHPLPDLFFTESPIARPIFHYIIFQRSTLQHTNSTMVQSYIKGRFLLFQVYRNFANLYFKLSVCSFYKEISKFQQKVQS